MAFSDASVPVYIDVSPSEILEGVFEIVGVLRYADDTVTFEYRTRDHQSEPSDVETFHLPLDQVREVELKRRILGAKILVHPRRLSTFEYVPGAPRNEIVFYVKQKHRQQAAALVSHLQRVLSERQGHQTSSIPFRLPDTNLGITENKGRLYLDEEFLVFEVSSSLSGLTNKKQQTVKIEPGALEEIRLDRGLFKDRLLIRPKNRELFRVMPGMYQDKDTLTMTIWKKYRADAEHLVDEVQRRSE